MGKSEREGAELKSNLKTRENLLSWAEHPVLPNNLGEGEEAMEARESLE